MFRDFIKIEIQIQFLCGGYFLQIHNVTSNTSVEVIFAITET